MDLPVQVDKQSGIPLYLQIEQQVRLLIHQGVIKAGDLMPTAAHVGAPYNMAYDLFPLDNRESKNKCLQQASAGDWLIFIDHEVATPAMTVARDKDWYRLQPA